MCVCVGVCAGDRKEIESVVISLAKTQYQCERVREREREREKERQRQSLNQLNIVLFVCLAAKIVSHSCDQSRRFSQAYDDWMKEGNF